MSDQKSLRRKINIMKSRARGYALQAIYRHLIAEDDLLEIQIYFLKRKDMNEFDEDFFREILTGVSEFKENLELQIQPNLDRPLNQLNYVEHAILLIGCYELNHASTPPAVVINEGVILAKRFGADESYKFINGVLDKMHKRRTKN